MLPEYSVLIPVYNGAEVLEETVLSAVNQTHPPTEIIVIDDCSTDDTAMLIKKLQKENPIIKSYKNNSNLGVAQTRNRGFLLATTEYLALLDADDKWYPTKLEQQLTLMTLKPCDFSYTGYSFVKADGTVPPPDYWVPEQVAFEELLKENVIGCATVVLKKDVFKTYTMSSEYAHEDYVLWLELLRDGKVAIGVPEPLMEYRIADHSRSGNKKKAAKGRWKIYREFLRMGRVSAMIAFFQYGLRGIKKHYFKGTYQ